MYIGCFMHRISAHLMGFFYYLTVFVLIKYGCSLSLYIPFLRETVSCTFCPFLSVVFSPFLSSSFAFSSLPGCLWHYANTFKGRLLLSGVILQWSCTSLMCLRVLSFLPNRSVSQMTPASRLNQGRTKAAHMRAHTLKFTFREHAQIKDTCTHI